MRRLTSLFLALLLLFSLTACGAKTPSGSSPEGEESTAEAPAEESAEPEPAPAAPTAPQETTKSDGDPMAGMSVVDAVQALVSEIQDKGIDMASVNARVRAKANEIGLTYASAACLIKAIGYVEARRVALGEK